MTNGGEIWTRVDRRDEVRLLLWVCFSAIEFAQLSFAEAKTKGEPGDYLSTRFSIFRASEVVLYYPKNSRVHLHGCYIRLCQVTYVFVKSRHSRGGLRGEKEQER